MTEYNPFNNLLSKRLLGKYHLMHLTAQDFQGLLDKQFYFYFDEQIVIKTEPLCSKHYQKWRAKVEFIPPKCLYLAVCVNETPILLFKGYPSTQHNFLMDITVVHPDFRRLGIYSAFLDAILNYTKEMGYSSVTSTHSPSNNPILLAKLKRGFYIANMLLTLPFGPEVELIYFHNETLKTAFLFRCGDLKMEKEIIENSKGSLSKLCDLLEH